MMDCWYCRGEGTVQRADCPICDGEGTLGEADAE